MNGAAKFEPFEAQSGADGVQKSRKKSKKDPQDEGSKKRRCISSACVPCRKRKSKCDGTTPSCSACAAVYNTECVYDPNSDHRRKGVYKKDIDNLKTRNSTLQTLVQAILNYPEAEVASLVQQIRTCESLDAVAEAIIAKESGMDEDDDDDDEAVSPFGDVAQTFESKLSGKMGELRLEDGSTRYIGGTSNLIYLGAGSDNDDRPDSNVELYQQQENPVTTWTTVTSDPDLIVHLMNMYFGWHYAFFTTLSKSLFYRDFLLGKPPLDSRRKTEYCTPLLVNAMLALGCHFTSRPGTRAIRDDSATAGDHFFKEAKRLILEGDLHEVPKLTTVQALALMSVREAGCGREAKGWVYSGMSFRMACDLGLNLDSGGMYPDKSSALDETEEDARRITFWGCFLFDKCWSNYLGRLPQLPNSIITVSKIEVFPMEDADLWSAYTDSGFSQAHTQPSRTRAVARQISALCEISSDLINFFYNPIDMDKAKGKQSELKKLSEIHQRLETWRRELPKELEPREGGLPQLLLMHMFFQLLYIHLFRPFLKYNQATSPLPAHVSPRKLCTQAAAMISKLLRLYKRSHGLRQICNVAVYIAHSACTIHLLNLPEKNARRDIIHGVKHLEEIAEGWLCARRTLSILSVLARKWTVDLPEEAATVLSRTDAKFGAYGDVSTPKASSRNATDVIQGQTSPPPSQYTIPAIQSAPFLPAEVSKPIITSSETIRHDSETRSLPPTSASDLQYTRAQRYPPSHPTATPRQSLDSTNSSGASPSQLFGGVDALISESQDWWLRDQSQLALGFDNWNLSDADIAWLNSSTAAVSPSNMYPTAAPTANGTANPSPTGNGNEASGYGGVLNTYNETDWYQ